jgi:hypothetical protein
MDLSLIAGARTKGNGNAHRHAEIIWILHVVPCGSEVSSRAHEVGTKSIVPCPGESRQ